MEFRSPSNLPRPAWNSSEEFFGVATLARRLDNMFAVLTQGHHFALPQHQTLRATLDWGYDLLSPTEQTVLRRIAIFRATLTLDSALAVVVGPAVSVENAIHAMAYVVAKSLLSADDTGDTVAYRLLDPTCLYDTERLAASDEEPPTARRQAEHHLNLIETAPPNWQSDAGKQWLQLHAGRIDFRAALDWSLLRGGDLSIGLRLTANSMRLRLQLSLTLEYVERIDRTLPRLAEFPQPDTVMETRLLIAFGYAIWYSAEPAGPPGGRICAGAGTCRSDRRSVHPVAGAVGHVGRPARTWPVPGGAGNRGKL